MLQEQEVPTLHNQVIVVIVIVRMYQVQEVLQGARQVLPQVLIQEEE